MSSRRGITLSSLWEGVRIAFDVLAANRLRALLTILGVGVGVSVVVTFGALVSGVRTSLVDAVQTAGPANFNVVRFDFTQVVLAGPGGRRIEWWNRPIISQSEAEIVDDVPGVEEALYNFGFSTNLSFEGERIEGVQAQGYGAGWPAYLDGSFDAGRDFTPAEVREGAAVVVLSAPLAEALFGRLDPIGRKVRATSFLGGLREEFRVIGVYQPAENIFSSGIPRWAVFPWSTALRKLRANDSQAQILVVPEEGADVEEIQADVIAALRAHRRLGPRDDSGFDLLESQAILDTFDRLTSVLFLVMLALSSAGLLVGGVGVIGIMLISVTERTREIGVRKSLGATRREILWQFLVEAGLLTTLGGAAGLVLGGSFAWLVSTFTPVPARIPVGSVLAALAGAALTGVLFGLLPALRASRLEPVEALRAE